MLVLYTVESNDVSYENSLTVICIIYIYIYIYNNNIYIYIYIYLIVTNGSKGSTKTNEKEKLMVQKCNLERNFVEKGTKL